MSNRSRIDDLISRYCPNGVDFKALGEIGKLIRGNGLPKSDFTESGVGAIHYGQIYTYYGTWTAETISHVDPETAAKLVKVDPGDVIITNTSENLEDVGKAVAWLGEAQIVTGGHATVFKHDCEPKFIAYWLQSPAFQRQKKKLATGTKVIDVSAKQLATVRMPVPPMEVQREIVRVLDLFQSLEAELEAELEARRTQYAHYRVDLLTQQGSAERVPLSDVCIRVSSGATPLVSRTDYYSGGDIPWLRTQEVTWRDIFDTEMKITDLAVRQTAVQWIPENCVIVAISGASAARAAVNKIPLTTNQHCCNLEIDPERAYYRYVYHWVAAHYEDLKARGQGARADLNAGLIKSFPIAVPPLQQQRRIADLLDKFDELVTDLGSGLPAELRARRQQYEYYRGRLLSFEEAVA